MVVHAHAHLAACRRHRQRRNVTLIMVEAILQWLNLIFYVLPNALLVSNPCYITSGTWFWFGFVQWTCWNTVSSLVSSGSSFFVLSCVAIAVPHIGYLLCECFALTLLVSGKFQTQLILANVCYA